MKIPLLGLGTYNLRNKECTKIVQEALKVGYRHIDTADAYDNHRAVGKGLQGFERSNMSLFFTNGITLSADEMKRLDGLHRNLRFCKADDATFDY